MSRDLHIADVIDEHGDPLPPGPPIETSDPPPDRRESA